MSPSLAGSVALVTGAASGIGRATALAFGAAGASVVVADMDAPGAEATAEAIGATGAQAVVLHVDVTAPDSVESMVRRAVERFGRLDFAHNNAGVTAGAGTGLTHLQDEATWDRVLGVNLKGVWLCMKYEIPQMLAQGGGAIVNTASVSGLVGRAGRSAYVASKHGVVGLTRTAAIEYARQGIRVNAVCPGFVRTPLVERALAAEPEREDWMLSVTPMGRLGTPEEVAAAVLWLCSDAASFVTGHLLTLDGGVVAQ